MFGYAVECRWINYGGKVMAKPFSELVEKLNPERRATMTEIAEKIARSQEIQIEQAKEVLQAAGYKVYHEDRVLTVNDKATIEAHMLDPDKGGSEDVAGMLKVFYVSLGSRMGRYLAANNAIAFRDRVAASGGKHVEGELVVIMLDVS
ncbi:MAG TPA: hypothetical protein VGJ20_43420 [Xanthobacteraceae bacterium]